MDPLAAAMAASPPTVADLQALITALQAQVAALQAATPAAPAASAAAVATFANTPQTLHVNDLIDYLTKRWSSIYHEGCKALDGKALSNGFEMTPDQTVVYVESFYHPTITMGLNQGSKQITNFNNSAGTSINLIKCYGQIDKATLKTTCKRYCSACGVDAQCCAEQNNTMTRICLVKSLMVKARARLLMYRNEYTFNGVEYAPLM
jgi:hypothetical protein